jgi:hypothetical protein
MSEGDPTKFHLDKSISVGHLVTTGMLIVALIGGMVTTDRRIERNSVLIEALAQRQEREVQRQAADISLMRDQLTRIEDKLDRQIEGRFQDER